MNAYVFANQKGGVGKTTVTLGIAAELAARGRRVLLIDLDPQASATKVVGIDVCLGLLTLNALAAASHLVVVTEPSFLALQGIAELLETQELVHAHYNSDLVLAGVVVNRVERTVEHRIGLTEIASFFGPELVWSPALPKRTVLQDASRRGQPLAHIQNRAARELASELRPPSWRGPSEPCAASGEATIACGANSGLPAARRIEPSAGSRRREP